MQDVFLRLQDEVLRDVPSRSEHILLALDLKSAFDTTGHELYGERTYNYVHSFLTDRTATINILKKLGHRPFACPIEERLKEPYYRLYLSVLVWHTSPGSSSLYQTWAMLYTPTLPTRGSLDKENTLQEAVQTVHLFAESCGMSCSPEKSELVRVHGRGYRNEHPFDINISDHRVREVEKARILGIRVQSNRHADRTYKALRTTVKQIACPHCTQ